MTVKLGEYRTPKREMKKVEAENVLKGLTVQELTPSLREQANLPEDLNGVMITGISDNSPAQGVLQVHDVIEEVDQKPIRGLADYEHIVSKIGKKDTVLLLVYRGGASVYITIAP